MSEISVLVKKLKSKSPTLSRADIALLVSNGQIIYSELSEKFKDLAKGEVTRSFNYWGIGDYFVKHFETANLIVGKVSDNLAFAICSREKTGLLILAFTNIVKNYKEFFKNIEDTLKISEVEEEVKPEKEVVAEKPTKPIETPIEIEAPEVSLSSWTVVELVPSVQTSTVTMDQDMITLLRHVDGWKTVEDLSKETNIPLEETIRKISYLVSKGMLKSKYDDPVYKKKPVLIAKGKIESAFIISFGTKLGKARSLNDILKHVDGEKTILDIARKLDARPEAIKALFQNLERRQIVELK